MGEPIQAVPGGQRGTVRRPRRLAAGTSALLVSGLVLAGCSGEPEAVDPAAVLAQYQEARNVNLVSEDAVDSQEWLDSLMSFYAEDAVVTGHPLDEGDPPIATGLDEIRALEAQIGPDNSSYSQRPAHATEFFDVEVSGDQATFRRHFFNKYGECSGGGVDAITVADGEITRYAWGEGANEACDPQQLAQNYEGTSVEFTGDDCAYSGPTEFTVGNSFEIIAVDASADSSDVGYAVSKVVDGTTVADVEQAQRDGGGEELFAEGGTYLWSKPTANERFMSTTLDAAGTWLLYCFFPSRGTQVYATTFEVVQ